ncbi:acetoacetate--CoA ligase [Mycolicibacterium sp. CBM1]
MTPSDAGPRHPAPDVVWRPTPDIERNSGLAAYLEWLDGHHDLQFGDYLDLWRWSIDELDSFWRSIDEFEGLGLSHGGPALSESLMPGAQWFPHAQLNYAEQAFRRIPDMNAPALILVDEVGDVTVTWSELRRQVAAFAAHLRKSGIGSGDRVVGYLPNTEVAIVAFLACASVGAVWSVCSPEFGNKSVVNRFSQLRPKLLVATTGYIYAGKYRDRVADVTDIAGQLESLEHIVCVDAQRPPQATASIVSWSDATAGSPSLEFTRVSFDHPLWVLFSSGTTGLPKGIVHGHGGIVVEHLKTLRLQNDLRCEDRFLFVGSTSWMVWNLMVSGLLVGATLVVLDGSPVQPDLGHLWRVAARHQVTILGMGAGLINTYRNAQRHPGLEADLTALRSIIVTGSPLGADGFSWVRDEVGPSTWLASCSGGTDICSAFVGGAPSLPVRAGRIQAPSLGVAVAAWNDNAQPVVGQPGELVVTKPMPSMPLYFWADSDGTRYLDSYFRMFPGVWRHGDYIEFDEDGSSVIHGRSDSTLNRQGVRMGSAEIYSSVEHLPEVVEALVVGVEHQDEYYVPLFVQLSPDADPAAATERIRDAIRTSLSARHLPDDVIVVPGIPHNRVGKKLEIPVKRLLQGARLEDVVDAGSVDNLEVLAHFAEAGRRPAQRATTPASSS